MLFLVFRNERLAGHTIDWVGKASVVTECNGANVVGWNGASRLALSSGLWDGRPKGSRMKRRKA